MDAERREALRLKTKSGNSVPVRNVMITAEELRALLADSEALERVEALPESLRRYGDAYAEIRGAEGKAFVCREIVKRIERALGRD